MPLRVINVVPNTRSNETSGDTEPSVAVDPANPDRIAVAAFTADPAGSGNAPLYMSTDGGVNWALVVCLPGGNTTYDSSIRFAGFAGTFYAAILRADSGNLSINRSAFPPAGLMTELVNRSGPDQPWVGASWIGDDERVYVSSNQTNAIVEFSTDAATAAAPAGFGAATTLQLRAGSSRPSVRTAIHRSGRIYVTYMRATGQDVVVSRDDAWGANGFADLLDSGDGVAGQRVVTGVTIPPVGTLLGGQRVSSRIAIAVDPRNRDRVYLAWCDGAVTAASPFTLHVRRSDDGGATWSADLRTIQNVTNPGIAVNIHGTVGLLYQQYDATDDTWTAIFERSTDRFATVATTSTLSDAPEGVGFGAAGPLGDFANLISVGADFYGAFCATNTPVNANFPSGVTYLRNADFGTGNLRNTTNTANVASSVDPFLFHWETVARKDDFYVRDWTDSAATHDTGVSPSIRAAFYVSGDVWNRRSSSPGAFVSDVPQGQDAGNGGGSTGDNWLFARVSRRAAGLVTDPATVVTAHFLVSKLGTGSNFVDASSADPDVSFTGADPTLSFAGDELGPKTTAAMPWHLAAVASTHLCIAVEISTPADPYVGVSLRGRAPGWPDTDLEIVDDNNKAQRNIGLTTLPAEESAGESWLWGLVHNAHVATRDLELGVAVDTGGTRGLRVLVDGRAAEIGKDRRLVLRGMAPGENRWVAVAFPAGGKVGSRRLVRFDELVHGVAVNGFALGGIVASERRLVAHTRARVESVGRRMRALLDLDDAPLRQEIRRCDGLDWWPAAHGLASRVAGRSPGQLVESAIESLAAQKTLAGRAVPGQPTPEVQLQ